MRRRRSSIVDRQKPEHIYDSMHLDKEGGRGADVAVERAERLVAQVEREERVDAVAARLEIRDRGAVDGRHVEAELRVAAPPRAPAAPAGRCRQ